MMQVKPKRGILSTERKVKTMLTDYYYFVNSIAPFLEAYSQTDLFGKGVFIILILLSILTWTLLIQKFLTLKSLTQNALHLKKLANQDRAALLQTELPPSPPTPYHALLSSVRRHTREMLKKNTATQPRPFLSAEDLDYVAAHLNATVIEERQRVEKYLFILATVISLAPFLGLLGTVWGFLNTFSSFQSGGNQLMLSGLSLALTTTVLGLVDAIPALVGYTYFRQTIRDFEEQLRNFATHLLATVELQYKREET